MFLIEMISSSEDTVLTCLIIKSRITYCLTIFPESDPFRFYRLPDNDEEVIVEVVDLLLEEEDLPVETPPARRIRRRSADDIPYPPSTRRRHT